LTRQDDPDVRPFFGERSEPVGPVPPREQPQARRGTIEERRLWKIAEGLCPRPGCNTELEDDACARCGWSLLEEQLTARVRSVEDRDDYLPTLPQALWLDEYGPANLDDAA
jgi:hypothetical protein